jgi:hypothetical protein
MHDFNSPLCEPDFTLNKHNIGSNTPILIESVSEEVGCANHPYI